MMGIWWEYDGNMMGIHVFGDVWYDWNIYVQWISNRLLESYGGYPVSSTGWSSLSRQWLVWKGRYTHHLQTHPFLCGYKDYRPWTTFPSPRSQLPSNALLGRVRQPMIGVVCWLIPTISCRSQHHFGPNTSGHWSSNIAPKSCHV